MDHSRPVPAAAREVGRWRRWRGWVTAALLAACVDGPTSPGLFGELRIRPSYPDGDAPTTLGLSVDSARVHVVRASEPSTALIDTMVRYDSDTASMGWVLTLRSEEEPLLVDVAIWDEGNRVYSGEREVVVRESAIAESGAEPVLVAYVGPPIATTVTVSPASVTLEALTATASYAAEARDRHDVVIATAFSWTSGDPGVATVDPATGAVIAVGNGTATIQATAGSASGSAMVVVAQRAASVAVSPESPTLTALGATLELQAAVRDANAFAVAGASVTWSSSDASVATVDATGTVTAVSGGHATITASSGDIAGSTGVTVNPVENVAAVTVLPARASLHARGATTRFTAEARDADGHLLAVKFVWLSTVETVATIDDAGLATATGHGTTKIAAMAGSVGGGATLDVDLTATVAQVVVSPSTATLTAVAATQQFTAEARDADGAIVPGVTPVWSSADEGVATVDAITGLATAVAHGATTIVATAGGVRGAGTIAVELTSTIASITVAPPGVTLTALGATQQFTAVARDANDVVVPGATFEWTSSATAVATIGQSTGLAVVAGHGTTTVTATANGVAGSSTLTADLVAVVDHILVTPTAAALTSIGSTQQFTAVARDASNATVPGVAVVWSSSSESVAGVDPASGLATATGHGSTNIVATVGDVRGSAVLEVELLDMIAGVIVSPAQVTLTALGATQQFTATAIGAGGEVIPGVPFVWSHGVDGVATIGESSGLATVIGNGSTTITASANGLAGTATLIAELRATVTSIVVSPANTSLTANGATRQFTAVARDANDAIVPGVSFTWSSTNALAATIDPATGFATATGHGSTTIIAAIGDVQGSTALSVNLVSAITRIDVAPANATLTSIGGSQQFTAVARDADNAIVPGVTFTWSSSSESVATIEAASGLATATGHGSTNIVARIGDVQGSATLGVEVIHQTVSVTVAPANVTLTTVGALQQFTATARDANGRVIPGVPFVWSSSTEDVATIGVSSGLATVTGNGTTAITASVNDLSGTATLTADLAASITSIDVLPALATLTTRGGTRQFTAVARDASNAIVAGVTVTWSSSNESVATIDPATGVATATGHGSTTITATIDAVQGSASLTVDLTPSIASIVVAPPMADLASLGVTQQFSAEARDAEGAIIPGITFAWSSSAIEVATIDGAGLATSVGNGATTIRATAGELSGTAQLNVQQRVVRVSVTPTPSTVFVGAFAQLTATAYDANDRVVAGRPVSWSSSDEDLARVDATGLVEGIARGTATIRAFVDDVLGTAAVSVECAPPPKDSSMLASIIVC